MSDLSLQPVIIIGAGRSGTNMLRDVLANLDGVGTWPCDEINYIWRYKNRDYATDEFNVTLVTPKIKQYIRRQFEKMGRSLNANDGNKTQYLVEKTCANSLRVDFVDAIVPEAKYLFLVRDGRDVVASARKRWKAPLDIPYLYAKARFVPFSDLGYYAFRYFVNRLTKLGSSEKSLSVWGPKFDGMKGLSEQYNLDYVCAAQWVRCVELSERSFESMPRENILTLRYEDFVKNPESQLSKITQFLGLDVDASQLTRACADVQTASIGKGKKTLEASDSHWLELMQPLLDKYGYN